MCYNTFINCFKMFKRGVGLQVSFFTSRSTYHFYFPELSGLDLALLELFSRRKTLIVSSKHAKLTFVLPMRFLDLCGIYCLVLQGKYQPSGA